MSNVFTKIVDKILYNWLQSHLRTTNNQFGLSLLLINLPIGREEAILAVRSNRKSSVPYIILISYSVNHLNKSLYRFIRDDLF